MTECLDWLSIEVGLEVSRFAEFWGWLIAFGNCSSMFGVLVSISGLACHAAHVVTAIEGFNVRIVEPGFFTKRLRFPFSDWIVRGFTLVCFWGFVDFGFQFRFR